MKERYAPLTDEEMEAVTVVFHQYETGLREGTIYTKVRTLFDLLNFAGDFFILKILQTIIKYSDPPLKIHYGIYP